MDDTIYKVTAPLMGTFYHAFTQGKPPLVEIGQKIETSDVLCVIESMKIFTGLRSEYSGIVKEILVKNEEAVMPNQPLIIVEKQ